MFEVRIPGPQLVSIEQFRGFMGRIMNEPRPVRYFNRPDVPEATVCPHCGFVYYNHGWLDFWPSGQIVCPGMYIVKFEDQTIRAVHKDVIRLLNMEAISGT